MKRTLRTVLTNGPDGPVVTTYDWGQHAINRLVQTLPPECRASTVSGHCAVCEDQIAVAVFNQVRVWEQVMRLAAIRPLPPPTPQE